VNNSTRGEIFATLAEQEQWEEASKLSQQGDFHSWCRSEQRNVWYQKLIDSRNIALLKTNVNNRTRFEIFSVLIRNGRLDDASALIDRKNKLDRWCTLDQRIIWYQKLIDNGNIALLKAYVNDHTKLEIFSVLVKNGKFEEVAGVISDKSRFHKWCPEDQRKEWYQKLIQVGRKEDVFLWMNDRTKREVFSAFVIENQWDIAFSLFSGLPQSKTDYTPLNRVATVNEDSLYYKSVSDLCSHCIESGDEGKVAYLWRNLDSGLKRQLVSKESINLLLYFSVNRALLLLVSCGRKCLQVPQLFQEKGFLLARALK
jgi:hypothetical protein